MANLKNLLKNKYDGAIFDLDQTLANTEDFILSSPDDIDEPKKYAEWHVFSYLKPKLKIINWPEFLQEYFKARSQIKEDLTHTAASHNRYLYIQRTLENIGLQFSPDLVYKATQVYWDHVINNMSLFPFVEIVLKRVKLNNMITGVVSDLTADIQIKKLEALGIAQYIDYLVTSEEALADKPDPRPIKLLLEKMELNNSEVVLIGNNPKTDIQGARNSGIDSVLFDYYDKYPNFIGNRINKFSDLLNMFNIENKSYSSDKLFVSDLFGTLTTEPRLRSVSLNNVLKSFGLKLEDTKVKKLYEDYKVSKISDNEFWRALGITESQIPKAEKLLLEQIEIRPDVKSTLKAIKKNYRTAILSNVPSRWGQLVVEKLNLDEFFEEIVFSGDYKTKKPDPKLYNVLLNKFHELNPSNIYYIDNEIGDLKAAKDLMLNTIWLEIKGEKQESGYIPDEVIADFKDVLNVLPM
jgi:HAD superfamily hydrolase (TIGR01509 family)